jgi:hypothetical protein
VVSELSVGNQSDAKSEADVYGLYLEGSGHPVCCLYQSPRVETGEVAVDQSLVVPDQALHVWGEPHVVETLGVESQLLPREI